MANNQKEALFYKYSISYLHYKFLNRSLFFATKFLNTPENFKSLLPGFEVKSQGIKRTDACNWY